MRFKKRMRAVLLGAATLGSGSILAAESTGGGHALSDANNLAQPAKRVPTRHLKKNDRTDSDMKKAAQAVTAVESKPQLSGQDGALSEPAFKEENLPVGNDLQPIEMKGVRG